MARSVRVTTVTRWLSCIAVWGVAATCGQARADGWDGLSELMVVARTAGIEMKAPAHLEMTALTAMDALLIIGPRHALPVAPITAFLREGGRVALLDDVGTGERLLSAYQVSRRPAQPGDVPALRGDASLLVAYPASEHPLVEGVPLLLTNRATELYHPDLRPVLTFGHSRRALALAGAIGAGRLVAVGDASVAINQMLTIAAHRRFAKNLLEYLWRPGGRIWLVGPNAEVQGGYGAGKPGFARLDEWLRQASHPDLPSNALLVLALAALAVACVLGVSMLPRRSPYVRPDLFPNSTVLAGYAGRVAVGAQPGVNLVWSLLDYKRELEAELSHRLHLNAPFDREQAITGARDRGLSTDETGELDSLLSSLDALSLSMDENGAPGRTVASDLRNVVRKGERLLSRLGNERG